MFQMTFAIITPALVIGGFAERIKFSAVILFTIFWLLAVYAPICHWVWGGGWLEVISGFGFWGWNGCAYHSWCCCSCCSNYDWTRSGFSVTPMPPHNLTLSVAGAGMLWVGWFGFNGGSALAANGDAGMAILRDSSLCLWCWHLGSNRVVKAW